MERLVGMLYSIGNYHQYPMINHDGKEYEYICITESLCCIAEINTVNQLDFNKKKMLRHMRTCSNSRCVLFLLFSH